MSQAIRPDFFINKLTSIQENDLEADKRGATEEEKAIYAMTQTKGWLLMKETFDSLYKELNQVNKSAIESGATLEEIGRNTIVVSLVQDILDKLLNKASDAVDACTQDGQ